ncbi:MAG: SMC-Scp complex subunit ScpB [bacterium]
MENSEKIIEAILFWKNEPISIDKLASMANVSVQDTESALNNIGSRLNSGIVIMRNGDKVSLRTSPEASEIIEKFQKEELSKELSKAALETLTIVLYKSPVRRSTVDYIRGVNSQFIIRHLEARGLVEKIEDPKDQRVNLYRPTFELLSYLGIKDEKELPEFDALREKVEVFVEQLQENEEPQQ